MIIFSVTGIQKYFGADPVLDGVDFTVRRGDRLALVGPNGAGKTTLFKILASLLEPDSGDIERHGSVRIGYLEQQASFDPSQSLWSVAEEGLSELIALREQVELNAELVATAKSEVERCRRCEHFDRLQHEAQLRGAYNTDNQVERVLTGLKFSPSTYQQPVGQLSGGQQNRLLLARVLLTAPDLLLLDEPSNHLDIEATQWLEDYLSSMTSTLLIVSHDRYLLDRVATDTLELHDGTVQRYAGNFTKYWQQKQVRVTQQSQEYEKQQALIAKTEDFIRRNHHGQKHTQAEDRKKKLSRLELVPPPRSITAPTMGFPSATRTGDLVFRVEGLSKSYDTSLFNNLRFDVARGERWGIFGPNGRGKTTLLRCLLGEIEADSGSVVIGSGAKIGYFDQHLTSVPEETPAVDAIRPTDREMIEPRRRDLLAKFGITGDMVFQRVGSLSGGERSRVALARLAALQANVLVIDEPTNHLDLWSRDALERSILEFNGTVVFVSHDRFFLNRVADHLLVLEPQDYRVVYGNYETYRNQLNEALVEKQASNTSTSQKSSNRKQSPALARKKRRFPYRQVEDIEQEIMTNESSIEGCREQMCQGKVLRDGEKIRQLKKNIEQLETRLKLLYEQWEEASELN